MSNLEDKISSITTQLEVANDYLDSERIIVKDIKKEMNAGTPIPSIRDYLQKLSAHMSSRLSKTSKPSVQANYKYAIACIKTLVTTPYWHSWIKELSV